MKLKPVIFVNTNMNRNSTKYSDNKLQQILLLKALRVTQDPKKLKEMIGARRVAEVYRTFEKLAVRKEFHKALARHGVDFDFIVGGLKTECLSPDSKPGDRIKGYQILLKSLGLDSYDNGDPGNDGSWEDELMKTVEGEVVDEKKDKPLLAENEYEVDVPQIPDSVKKKKEEDLLGGACLYD